MNEVLSLFLVREYYLCVCSMEMRKMKLKGYLICVVASLFALICLGGSHFIVKKLDDYLMGIVKWWEILTHAPYPVHKLASICLTGFILYYGVHIIKSLLQSRSFRETSGVKSSNTHSILIVGFVMFHSLSRVVLEMAKFAWFVVLILQMVKCETNPTVNDCLDTDTDSANMVHVGVICTNLMEILCILIVGIHKNKKGNLIFLNCNKT